MNFKIESQKSARNKSPKIQQIPRSVTPTTQNNKGKKQSSLSSSV